MNEPTETLDERIRHWVGQGFRVTTQTTTSAQLIRPKRFNPAEFIAMPLYLIEYVGQKEQTVYLSMTNGQATETTTGMERSGYRKMQDRSAAARFGTVIGGFVIFIVVVLILQQIL